MTNTDNARWPEPLQHLDDAETPEQAWEFWKGIVLNEDGSVNVEQLKLELSDFSTLMRFYERVLCEVTGNRISKCTTHPSAVISVFNDHLNDLVDEAVKERLEESYDPDNDKGIARDAARYRALRECHWNTSPLAVVAHPRKSVMLGAWCPSEGLLDQAVDEMIEKGVEPQT